MKSVQYITAAREVAAQADDKPAVAAVPDWWFPKFVTIDEATERGWSLEKYRGWVACYRQRLSAAPAAPASEGVHPDTARLDYIERSFSAVTTQERYMPLRMIWGKGCNGRTLREACDKYMARAAAKPGEVSRG